MTKRTIIPLLWLVVLAAPFAGLARTERAESRWLKTPPKIDGEISDWQAPLFHVEKAVQVDYAFSNDAENLYLVFVFKEAKFISSLAQTGFTLWFNEQGKKKKKLGLRFEKRALPAAEAVALMEKQGGPLPEAKKKELLAKPAFMVNQFVAVDDDNRDITVQAFPQPPLPEFASQSAAGRLTLEFRIPMGVGNMLKLAPDGTAMVGFEWGGLTKEMRREMMQRGGYEGGGGGGGMPESQELDPEGAGERDSGGLPSLRHGPKHYLFWCDLILAAGAN
jgi:hypothetical protein